MKSKNEVTPNNDFFTPEEVADILRINVLTVYSYIQKEHLAAIRLGRNYRISREDLMSFIHSKRTTSTQAYK